MSGLATEADGARVKVWDLVVRIFHWTTVFGCILNLFILEGGEWPHEWVGYSVAAVLTFRIVWGFIGTRHARFAEFLPSPKKLSVYLVALAKGKEPRTLGHNPAGALMMLTLMILVSGVSVTGFMMTTDTYWGVEWVEETHELMSDLILYLAILHALAALFESWRHRENLVWSMITGWKRQ